MGDITTHVLDTARGQAATGVAVLLEEWIAEQGWKILGRGETDGDGRCHQLLDSPGELREGLHRLTFDAGAYHRGHGREAFFPEVVVVFQVRDAGQRYHVPLLLSPYGYTTYRGS
jgi:5-hydroxyisourate hydrolase